MRQAGGGYYDWFWPGLLNALDNPANGWIKLATVSEYLESYKPADTIQIERGSWESEGQDRPFHLGQHPPAQGNVARLDQTRKMLLDAAATASPVQMAQAWDYFITAETSCYWYWNLKSWADKEYHALDLAMQAVKSSRAGGPKSKSAARSAATACFRVKAGLIHSTARKLRRSVSTLSGNTSTGSARAKSKG